MMIMLSLCRISFTHPSDFTCTLLVLCAGVSDKGLTIMSSLMILNSVKDVFDSHGQ